MIISNAVSNAVIINCWQMVQKKFVEGKELRIQILIDSYSNKWRQSFIIN